MIVSALSFFTTGCPTPHDGFPVDLGSAATMINVIAGGVLFHNGTTPHDCFCVDPNMSANTVMTSVTTGVECNSELCLV
jgi:hypothetical protein